MTNKSRNTLVSICVAILLICFASLLLRNCGADVLPESAPTSIAMPKAQTGPVLKTPTPEHCLGKWSGRWDGKWAVHFTVTRDPQEAQRLIALYEWEETPGKPLRQQSRPATLDGNVLRVGQTIEITFSTTNPNRAAAVGNFANRRTAELTRE